LQVVVLCRWRHTGWDWRPTPATHWHGELVSHRERLARPIATADAVIAAIALAYGAALATRNIKDLAVLGLQPIHPWLLP